MIALFIAIAFILSVICIPLIMFVLRDLAMPKELDWEDD